MSETTLPLWVALALLAALLVSLVFVSRQLYSSIAPLWLIPRGDHAGARRCYERTRRGFPARFHEGTRLVTDYGIGLCAHLAGDHEGALAKLRVLPYERLSKPLQFCVDTTIATALLWLGRDLEEARERFLSARANIAAPDLVLGAAVASRRLGDAPGAARLFDEAAVMQAEGALRISSQALIRRDAAMVQMSTALLRGWYLVLIGRPEQARPLLQTAAASPPGLTRDKARELLAGLPPTSLEDDELPPSSLSPLIGEAGP